MLRNFLLALLGAPFLILLAGCCGNGPCDCQDSLADALYFGFQTTGPNAFSRAEIATVYLARYDTTNLKISRDSLPLVLNQRVTNGLKIQIADKQNHVMPAIPVDTAGLLILNNTAPFSVASSNGKLSQFVYRLYVPQDSAGTFKKRTFTTYSFDRIRLVGRYKADGCCTCYENSLKRVRVLGGSFTDPNKIINVTESGSGSNRVPVVIQLTK